MTVAINHQNLVNNLMNQPLVIKSIDNILKYAIDNNASAIHIEKDHNCLIARCRINGSLANNLQLPLELADAIILKLKNIAKISSESLTGYFSIKTLHSKINITATYINTSDPKIILSLQKQYSQIFTLESLGFSLDQLNSIKQGLSQKHGLVFIIGPENSGKTTTSYSLLDYLDKPDTSISTIEELIEFNLPRVNQSQINNKIGYTTLKAIKSIKSQDPDIIFISNITDSEVIKEATILATNKLVIATLEAPDLAGGIILATNLNSEKFLTISNINFIIFQSSPLNNQPKFEVLNNNTELTKILLKNKSIPEIKQFLSTN